MNHESHSISNRTATRNDIEHITHAKESPLLRHLRVAIDKAEALAARSVPLSQIHGLTDMAVVSR